MEYLLKEIRRVRRRLAMQHFLGILGWCWLVSLAVAAVVIGAIRIWPLTARLHVGDWPLLTGFLAAGLVAAAAWTFFRLAPPLRAALEIDRRCGLKERVSSTLAMNEIDRQSEAGQAVIADADAKLRRAAVLEQFRVRPPRNLLFPLAPAALALAIILFWSPAEKKVDAADAAAKQSPPVEIVKSAEDLRQKLAERRKDAEKAGMPDATELLKKLEQETGSLKSQTDREKALVKLNDLARELQQRRTQLGSSESLKREMEQVQDLGRGPAEKLAKALAQNDFDKAAHELEKLQKQLTGGGLDEAEKNDLGKQIDKLTQKLDQLAKQANEAQAEMQKRTDRLKQSGDADAAQKLEGETQKFQQQGPRLEALKGLTKSLAQCVQQMKQGKNGHAAQAMHDALKQMQELARQQNELKTLDDAMQSLGDARRQMTCDQSSGNGARTQPDGKARQGEGNGAKGEMAGVSDVDTKNNGSQGTGIGSEPGNGRRSDAIADAKFYDSRVRQQVGKGTGIVAGLTGGPNLKNRAEAEIQEATAAIERASTAPLSGQRLPKKQSENAKEYFDSFREGN